MKKLFIILLKIGLSVAIITWLVWDATRGDAASNPFKDLRDQSKNWWLLAAAWACCTAAVLLTLIRWCYLVRALELPFRIADALRIGFLGFLVNFAPMGIVGGDLLKALMLAREHRRHRAKAVASVVVDRLIGLYMLFVVATVAILLAGFWKVDVPEIRIICIITFALTVVGALGIGVLMIPGLTDGRLSKALGRLPKVGHTIKELIDAVRMYRRKPHVLVGAALISVGVHSLFATGVFLIASGIASGLPGDVLSLGTHFVVTPLSASAGVLPLPLGPFEFVLEFLYVHVPESGVVIAKGQGLIVALVYRLITILIAAIGLCYYLGSRREVAEAMHEAEREQQAQQQPRAEGTA